MTKTPIFDKRVRAKYESNIIGISAAISPIIIQGHKDFIEFIILFTHPLYQIILLGVLLTSLLITNKEALVLIVKLLNQL